jgi:hypothetical protein
MSTVRDATAQAPIFLTGFARSGTTWFNRLFRDYFDAGFVNEGQFIVSFGQRLSSYGDLRAGDQRRRLLADLSKDPFFEILKRNYSADIDWNRVAGVQPTFDAIVIETLRQIATQTGKTRIGSKYPIFGWHLDLINRLFPTCRVVHVIRDGRDCALSQKHMVWGHQNIYASALHWRNYLHKARRDGSAMAGRYFEIRYEDLLSDPEQSMAALEQFITGTIGPVTQRFVANSKQLRREKIAAWRRDMQPASQALFEGVAGDALEQAGYPLTGNVHRASILMRGVYVAHDRLSREAWYWSRKVFPAIRERK